MIGKLDLGGLIDGKCVSFKPFHGEASSVDLTVVDEWMKVTVPSSHKVKKNSQLHARHTCTTCNLYCYSMQVSRVSSTAGTI